MYFQSLSIDFLSLVTITLAIVQLFVAIYYCHLYTDKHSAVVMMLKQKHP